MTFLVAAILTCFLTVPGMYLIRRARLATSITETISTGFFFGLGLLVVFVLCLGRFLPSSVVLTVLVTGCGLCFIFLLNELKKERLPLFSFPVNWIQLSIVFLTLLFMLVCSFGDLSTTVDDDFFIHGPIIKRIAMGDIPPHMPFFPDTYLRGHVGRNIFTGSIASLLDLRPELAIMYVTLAICPFYVLVFHALAQRLAGGKPIETCFCFIGLLFLVSGAIGTSEIRAGSITYIWNNNEIAYSHLVFVGWLTHRAASRFIQSGAESLFDFLRSNKLLLAICVLAYVSMYYIYLSNFLMFSLFLVCLPFLTLLTETPSSRVQQVMKSVMIVGSVVACGLVLVALTSPFFMERILITLKLQNPSEPFGFMQQARFTFPKPHLFTITDPGDNDISFFRGSSLRSQGLSFYLGLLGLLVGFFSKRPAIVSAALFGCIPMIWLLTVDMGEYRADTLRLLLTAHIGFGASAGLVLGITVTKLFEWMDARDEGSRQANLFKTGIMLSAALMLAFMSKGNLDKFIAYKHHRIAQNVRHFAAVHRRNPENWLRRFCLRRIDNEAFEELQNLVRRPSERVLLRIVNDPDLHSSLGPMVNAATISGAGVVGVCQMHSPRGMGAPLLPSDYRSTLFFRYPTRALLDQLSADWIILDPKLVERKALESIFQIPGVSQKRIIEDGLGNKRILLHYLQKSYSKPAASGVNSVSLIETSINTAPQALVSVVVKIDPKSENDSLALALLILDEAGHQANIMDMPFVPVEKVDRNAGLYRIYFSMIQSGKWKLFLVDPRTNRKLCSEPLHVNVDNSVPTFIGD